jgi:hypothetical protein
MIQPNRFQTVFALFLCGIGGCRLFPDHELVNGRSPLTPAQASPDSVAMEIIWARFPVNDPVLNDAAWREIDETQIEPSVRRELIANGLRAGIVGASVPQEIAHVLHQGESLTKSADTAAQRSDSLNTEPVIHGRTLRVRRNHRTEIQASEIYPTLQLLLSGSNELGGHTYEQAQAIYALRADPQPDRMVRVDLTPELHCGEPRLRFTGGEDGLLRQLPLRERKVFEHLRLSVKLAPGEMLLVMGLPDSGSRLGHYFHTAASADGPQQKLILIRLAEVPPSDTFARNGGF